MIGADASAVGVPSPVPETLERSHPEPIVRLRDVRKRFGAVTALAGASLDVYPGEIHVVLGENGAGKTSLMSVLAGLYRPDEGVIEAGGRPVTVRSPRDALELGVVMVHQHFELVPNLTVWENVVLGAEGAGLLLRPARQRERVRRLAEEHGIEVDVDARVAALPVGVQQKVEILKLLYRQARILILDEPTTFLTPQESDALLQSMSELAARGLAVLLVTHKLRDAMTYGHRLTVMRAGRVVATMPRAEATEEQLVRMLMGEDQGGTAPAGPAAAAPAAAGSGRDQGGQVLLALEGVSTRPRPGRLQLHDVTLRVAAGEIHGIAGVAGNGQKELAEAVAGLLAVAAGAIRLRGQDVSRWPTSRRLDAGLALIPDDRIKDGILPEMSLWETLVLGLHRRLFPGARLDAELARRLGEDAIAEFEIRAPHAGVATAHLSGGNIQKVLVARTGLAGRGQPPVVVAANPTRGLDLRTVRRVHEHLAGVAARGGAVLLLSEDLDELMAVCHRISVLYRGRLVAAFDGPAYDRYRVGEAMLGRTEAREVPA